MVKKKTLLKIFLCHSHEVFVYIQNLHIVTYFKKGETMNLLCQDIKTIKDKIYATENRVSLVH